MNDQPSEHEASELAAAGPIELAGRTTVRREKGKSRSLRHRLLMECQNCHGSIEVPTLWALAADSICHGICEKCQVNALIDSAMRDRMAELRIVSRGMELIDRK